MMPLLRRAAALFAAVLFAVGSSTLVTAAPAQAFGGETFGCRVSPGTDLAWRTFCANTGLGASVYNAGFALRNRSGEGYTYSWSITGSYQYVISGCTATSFDCALAMSGYQEGSVTVHITYSQGGQSATKFATASIAGWR